MLVLLFRSVDAGLRLTCSAAGFPKVIPDKLMVRPRRLSTRIEGLFAVHFLSSQYASKVLLSQAYATETPIAAAMLYKKM